ncbi:MAG: glycoside hydrolase family 16 protein [Opitutales bacterium]|nr:glycoside hydrolase family 16 protein [Opitutales bacterium]
MRILYINNAGIASLILRPLTWHSAARRILLSAIFFSSFAGLSAANWQLVWSDEFETDGYPDPDKWSYDLGTGQSVGLVGWGNNEAQYYTDRLENARVEDGRLIIEARKEAMGNSAYTSARMVTREKGDWLYGRIEVRAMMPAGVGTWPAIWMLPTDWEYGGWPASGEIDIMEHVGFNMGTVHGTIHTNSFNHMIGTDRGGSIQVDQVATAFHTYAIEWEPDTIRWYVDDQEYFEFPRQPHYGPDEWPFDRRFHLILNIAIGGNWGGQQGIDDSIFPQTMEVEYVRVYQRDEDAGGPQIPGAWIYFLNTPKVD